MKILQIVLILVCACALRDSAFPQDQGGKWTRLQSDNLEFSIEVPDDFSYIFDPGGFKVSSGSADHSLREVSIVNAYRDGTLVSFEIYKASSDALDALATTSVNRGVGIAKTKFNGITAKEIEKKSDEFYFISRYFKSKGFVYVITGLARTSDTPVMKRFFESLKFVPGAKDPLPDARRLSTVSTTPINIKTRDVAPAGGSPPSAKPTPSPDDKPLIVASKPRASYVDNARSSLVQGTVQLRIEFGKNGHIPSIEVLKTLPEGLFRQSLFAAFRLKFLPAIRNGEPVSVKRVVEYGFSIY